MSSVLATLQTTIKTRLEADPLFATVPVFTEDQADLEAEIDRALAVMSSKSGKCGACVVIIQPEADVLGDNAAGPQIKARLRVHCLEALLYNRNADTGTGYTAFQIAEQIASLLHAWTPAGLKPHQKLRVKTLRPLSLPEELTNVIGHEVLVEQQTALAEQ